MPWTPRKKSTVITLYNCVRRNSNSLDSFRLYTKVASEELEIRSTRYRGKWKPSTLTVPNNNSRDEPNEAGNGKITERVENIGKDWKELYYTD